MSLATASNLSDLLGALAIQHRERLAVVGEHGGLSFAALDRAADRWAAGLRRAGYGPGTHVALLAGNGPEWLAAAFGVWRAGATLVPVSTFVTPRELGEILVHADAAVLIVQPRLRSHDYLDALARHPALPVLREIVVLGEVAPAGCRSAAEFVRERAVPENTNAGPARESIACILYTSGTTGQPKGVMLSHGAILATALPTAERAGLTPDDSLLSALPLFWVAGLVIRALPTLTTGCTLIVLETFTVDGAVEALRRHRPTALHLRPPQVGQVLAHRHFEPAWLANVRRGGGRVEWYAPYLDPRTACFITGYGMTETAGYVTALDWQDPPDVRRSQLGAPLPGVELRTNESGEILVRSPGMFSGYYVAAGFKPASSPAGDKHSSGSGLDADGFFMTGDLGRIDASGTFHFTGRSKDLLRVKGINVAPVEVEAVLSTHPAVEAVYVVGVPPDGLEQQVVALVVVKPDAHAKESELRRVADDALSHYKRPAHYLFITRADVPLSGTSKPQRPALAELAAQRLRARSAVAAGFKPASFPTAIPKPAPKTPTVRWRRSPRLQGYDYGRAGMYFCTLVAARRQCIFGDIGDTEIRANRMAAALEKCWRDLPAHYPHVVLDEFVVMPNHVHWIVALKDAGLKPAATQTLHGLPEIIRGFKTFSARHVNLIRGTPGVAVWQHGYYEHIIRDEDSLNRIREYIANNPLRWVLDRENPERQGQDDFDTWLETFRKQQAPGQV